MASNASRNALERSKARRRIQYWNKVVTGMAAVVVFCTTYALILPAITMEREPTCGIEEHQHSESCYELPKELTCFYQRSAEAGDDICVVHTHDNRCYDTKGSLICALPEVELHTHDDSCFRLVTPEPPHIHTDACWEEVKVLTCGREETDGHSHTPECEQQEERLLCEIPETPAHVHSDDCMDADGNVVCAQEKTDGHTHGSDCVETKTVYTCGQKAAEPHHHTEECYAAEKKLICGKEQATAEELANPPKPYKELVCGKQEIRLHTHGKECVDEAGSLICTKAEVLEHIHIGACLSTTTDLNAEKILGCGLEEHTHDEILCYIDTEADLETRELWETTLPELSGENCPEDLLAVALSQLDYQESTVNVNVTPDGEILGYTRYGQWSGELYGPWSEHFVNFCRHYAGIPADAFPRHEGEAPWCEKLSEDNFGIYFTPDAYTPVPGDTVFFDLDLDGSYDHMAIAEQLLPATETEAAKLLVIEGDVNNAVQRGTYKPDAPEILGYASTEAACARWAELNPAPAEQPEEPDVYCGQESHIHTEECMDESGSVICGKQEHIHGGDCLIQPPVYICGQEQHRHEDACYNNEGTLTCGMQEHEHSDDCLQKTYYCGMEAHTHESGCRNEAEELICTVPEHIHSEDCLVKKIVYKQVEDLESLTPGTAYAIVYDDGQGACLMGGEEGMMNVTLTETIDEHGVPGANLVLDGTDGSQLLPESCLWQPAPAPATLELGEEAEPQQPDMVLLNNVTTPEAELLVTSAEEGLLVTDPNAPAPVMTLDLDWEETPAAPTMDVYEIMPLAEPPLDTDATGDYKGGVLTCPGDCKLGDKVDPDNWKSGTGTDPFGTAQEYNLFLLGNIENWGCVHGNAAIMGNIIGSSNDITYNPDSNLNYAADATPHFEIGLTLGGSVLVKNGVEDTESPYHGDVTVYNGSVVADNTAQLRVQMDDEDDDHRHIVQTDSLDPFFAKAEGALWQRNQQTYDYCVGLETNNDGHLGIDRKVTGQDVTNGIMDAYTEGDILLQGANPFYNVFNLTVEQVQAGIGKEGGVQLKEFFLDVPFGSYTIINIIAPDGSQLESYNFDKFDLVLRYRNSDGDFINEPADKRKNDQYTQTQRTLVNFDPAINQVTTAATTANFLYASVLGPHVDLIVPENGAIDLYGTIVLDNMSAPYGNNSNIIYNPFQRGAQLKLKKLMTCDDYTDEHKEDHKEINKQLTGEENMEVCLIHKQNNMRATEDSGQIGGWVGYYADITLLTYVDGVPITATFEGLPVNGREIDIDGLTPGTYQITDELVYRRIETDGVVKKLTVDSSGYLQLLVTDDEGKPILDENGRRQFVRCDADGNEITSTDRGDWAKDPVLYGHVWNFAAFEDENGSYKSIYIGSGQEKPYTIVNHYALKPKTMVPVRKLWGQYIEITYIDGSNVTQKKKVFSPEDAPKDAKVEVTLYRENPTTPLEQVPGVDPLVLSEKNDWYGVWSDLDVGYNYEVKESKPWPGYTVEVDPPKDETGAWTVTNLRREVETTALTVDKEWYDATGQQIVDNKDTPVDELAGYESTVQLYRQSGTAKTKDDPSVQKDLRNMTLYLGEGENAIFCDDDQFLPGGDIEVTAVFYIEHLSQNLGFNGEGGTGEVKLQYEGKTYGTLIIEEKLNNGIGIDTDGPEGPIPPKYYYKAVLTTDLLNVDKHVDVSLLYPTGEAACTIIAEPKTVTDATYAPYTVDLLAPAVTVTPRRVADKYIDWNYTEDGWTCMDSTRPIEEFPLHNGAPQLGSVQLHSTTPNKWTYTWHDLPTGNGLTRYRYFVRETHVKDPDEKEYKPEYYYTETDLTFGDLTEAEIRNQKLPGVNSGFIVVSNKPIIGGPELPDCGGMGTTPYTLGGLLTVMIAALLMQANLKKRRKEGNAS